MIPISTDAPIYHMPIATVTFIAVNILCFIAFCMNAGSTTKLVTPDGRVLTSEEELFHEVSKLKTDEEVDKFFESLSEVESSWRETLSVEFGTFKPWQWLTNNFMHADWGHLIGNMVFLWAFGLIVEGKVGAIIFSLIYLGIGAGYGCVLQSCSLVTGWEGTALGASAAIFGLLALCVIWAPANEFTVLLRFTTVEVSILLYGFLFLGKEFAFWALGGFHMSSELLHILGFIVAAPVGIWMVNSGRVDCEGWDLMSYLANKTGNESTIGKSKSDARQRAIAAKEASKNKEKNAKEAEDRAAALVKMQEQVGEALAQGKPDLAIKLQTRIMQLNPSINWKQQHLFRVVQMLLKNKDYQQALPLIEKHVDLFEQSRSPMQVAMLKIWLSQQRAKEVLTYLKGLNPSFMSPEEQQQFRTLAANAKKQLAAQQG